MHDFTQEGMEALEDLGSTEVSNRPEITPFTVEMIFFHGARFTKKKKRNEFRN